MTSNNLQYEIDFEKLTNLIETFHLFSANKVSFCMCTMQGSFSESLPRVPKF